MSKKIISQLTLEQKSMYEFIENLKNIISSGTLSSSEMAYHIEMTKKQKEKLVSEIYFKDKKKKEFYTCKDGRVKSYNPQFIAPTKAELIDRLYDFYFKLTLKGIYEEWVQYRKETATVSSKTIEEDMSNWRRFLADSNLASMQIQDIKPSHLMKLFQKWTGNGLITRKDFNNRKSTLNGIFRYAVLNEYILNNPINSLSFNELKYKMPARNKKAYTVEERQKLLDYLRTLEPDAYVCAINLAFLGIFRIGEIKAIQWNPENGNSVTIRQQLVEERELDEDMNLSSPKKVLKNPKGNPNYSIRTQIVSDKAVEVLSTMKRLNPNGEVLFMHEGRYLTTETFNRRLAKYCNAINIPYLSSHKIRFTGASMLYDAGVKAIDIQPLLGHSNLAMTQHYIGQRVRERDVTQMAQILV